MGGEGSDDHAALEEKGRDNVSHHYERVQSFPVGKAANHIPNAIIHFMAVLMDLHLRIMNRMTPFAQGSEDECVHDGRRRITSPIRV